MQDYKSLYAGVTIYATLVNTEIRTLTDRQQLFSLYEKLS